jgi:hypothetical protein
VIRLSVSIMADVRREQMVFELQSRLDRPAAIAWDYNGNGPWPTGRAAWELHDPVATHHMVLQDDAVICRDLVAGLERALQFAPKNIVVSPFMGSRTPPKKGFERAIIRQLTNVRECDTSFVVMRPLCWGVGIVTPTYMIPEMIRWCNTQRYPYYDRRVGQFYLRAMRWPTWCTFPSLIDHRDAPSLLGHGQQRVSRWFIGEDRSALDVDWSRKPLMITGLGIRSRALAADTMHTSTV